MSEKTGPWAITSNRDHILSGLYVVFNNEDFMKQSKPKIPTYCTLRDKTLAAKTVKRLESKGYLVTVFEINMNNKIHYNVRCR